MQIKAIDPINRPFFAGEVSGIDWRKVPSPQEAEAIHRGMDEFGVLPVPKVWPKVLLLKLLTHAHWLP